MSELFDFIIVGSGPSGSVLAHRLTAAGARCLMLEAGNAWQAKEYPENELHANAKLLWNGGMDANTSADLLFLRGKVLGGGSVVNQCLLDRFDDIAWNAWRNQSGIDWFNTSDMAPYYDRVESDLTLHQMQPEDWNRNAEIYVEGFEKCGLKWAPLRRGQSNCGKGNDCMRCLGGCPRESKQSMPVTYLKKALSRGLEVKTGVEVDAIVDGAQFVSVSGIENQIANGKPNRKPIVAMGKKLIMAAGSLGTNKILLKSGYKKSHKGLGEGFYCHPQFMTLAKMNEIVDSHKGAFQAVKSDDPRFREQGFKLENVFAGPIAVSMLKSGFGAQHHRFMRDYRKLACIEVAVRDSHPGQIRLSKLGRLKISKKLSDQDWHKANAGNEVVRQIFEKMGARELCQSPMKIGLHLMGGVAIGQGESSVVDSEFRLNGSDKVIIADGSIFPNAPGINPSLSIMALSHKAADCLLKENLSKGVKNARGVEVKKVAKGVVL